jgi:hypothetical protein
MLALAPIALRQTPLLGQQTGTLQLSPQDTFLNLNASSYSGLNHVSVYTWPNNTPANVALLKFDLSTVPAGATITSATLHLALINSDGLAGTTYTVAAQKVLRGNPVIAAATGYTSDGTTPWTANTCCYNSVPLAQGDIGPAEDAPAIDQTPGFKTWTITKMVQQWQQNPATNFGVLLNADTSQLQDHFRWFASMANTTATLRPYLSITYSAAAQAPSVSLTAPAAGSVVSGSVAVTANASGNAVAGVQFLLNGAPLGGEDPTSPYSFTWDTTTVADGSYTLAATARDAAGNKATSVGVPVTVKNGVLVLTPTDTSLNLNTTNYSTDPLLRTYTWPTSKPANVAILKFDLSSVPAGTTVQQATLNVALVQSDGVADTYTVAAQKITGHNPVIATANGYTADGVTNWSPSTCCYNGIPLAEADISIPYDRQTLGTTAGFNVWTLTNMVQEWVNSPSTNFGVLLNADASKAQDRYRFFASTKYADVTLRPFLRVKLGGPAAGTTPPAISGVSASAITTNTATIGWNTSTASDSQVDYGLTSAYGQTTTLDTSLLTTHSVGLSGLQASSTYHFRVRSRDSAGNLAISTDYVFTTAAAPTPPMISGVAASSITASAATITWTTDKASSSQVDYGPTSAYGQTTALSAALVTVHTVVLSGLQASSTYHYRVRSADQSGNLALSSDAVLTTLAPPDTTPPTVSLTAPAASSTVSGTVTVSANASDNVGVAGVQFLVDGAALGAEVTTAPYSVSWNTTTVADGSHTLAALARDAAGNMATSAGVTVTVKNTQTPVSGPMPPSSPGLASKYPGDVGIEKDPSVVFVEHFNEGSLSTLFSNWTDIRNGNTMTFAADVPPGSPGTQSLSIPWNAGVTNGGHLYKQLPTPVTDTLYLRYYIKYPTTGIYNHTSVWMGGYNPPTPWPNPQAGVLPVGNDRFSAAAEQNPLTSAFDHYDYWMGMHQATDGSYWGNRLLNNPNVTANVGGWTCVEQMVKLNNPVTASNGEHAIWLNGVQISHLGQGFPNGTWSGGNFTQTPNGSPFPGFQWRSDANLGLNWIWLQNDASNATGTGTALFDHLVAATTYIGCLASGGSSGGGTGTPPDPPTATITSPAAGATVSGTVSVSATTSGMSSVAGVQFKLDGANLGPQVTSAPYATSWDTTTAANGTHVLTATAIDSGGNIGTSAAVAVTVSNTTSPPVTGTGFPNEPSGLTPVTTWGFDQAPPSSGDVAIPGSPGWRVSANSAPGSAAGWVQLSSDSSAPASPPNVYDFVYPKGMVEGTAPATVYHALNSNEVFAGFWWKPSSPFDYGPNGNKLAFMFNGAGGNQFMILLPDGKLHVLPQYPGDFRWRDPNVNATTVTLGVWHRVEWYVQLSTGTLKWWLDGVLQGSYTNVSNSYSFDEFQFSPTWGGNTGAQKAETDHYWFDQVYISAR